MNTRDRIISLLSQSKKPLRAKKIAFELKKSDANIRKILSNLCKEGKIERVGFGDYRSSVNVKNESVNVSGESVNVKNESVNVLNKNVNVKDLEIKKLINKEIYKYRKAYLQKLKVNDPESFESMKKARREYYERWRAENPDYNKKWLRSYRKKHPEKFRIYERRYWLKKAMSED